MFALPLLSVPACPKRRVCHRCRGQWRWICSSRFWRDKCIDPTMSVAASSALLCEGADRFCKASAKSNRFGAEDDRRKILHSANNRPPRPESPGGANESALPRSSELSQRSTNVGKFYTPPALWITSDRRLSRTEKMDDLSACYFNYILYSLLILSSTLSKLRMIVAAGLRGRRRSALRGCRKTLQSYPSRNPPMF